MFPEYAMQLKGADVIVTGDGEDAFMDIVRRYDEGSVDFSGIPGVWFKSDGEVIKNQERRSSKILPHTHGQTEDDHGIKIITFRERSSPWSQQPSPAVVVLTLVHFV